MIRLIVLSLPPFGLMKLVTTIGSGFMNQSNYILVYNVHFFILFIFYCILILFNFEYNFIFFFLLQIIYIYTGTSPLPVPARANQ